MVRYVFTQVSGAMIPATDPPWVGAGVGWHSPGHTPSLLLHHPLPRSSSTCGTTRWANPGLTQLANRPANTGFTLTLLSALSHSAQRIWPCKLRRVQSEAGTFPAAYVCTGWQRNHRRSPPAHRTVSEDKIYGSAVMQHQALALLRVFTATAGARHADLPSTSSREGPEMQCHIQKPQACPLAAVSNTS